MTEQFLHKFIRVRIFYQKDELGLRRCNWSYELRVGDDRLFVGTGYRDRVAAARAAARDFLILVGADPRGASA